MANKGVGSGPAGRGAPMNKSSKSLVNAGKNGTYAVRPDASSANKGLGKGSTPAMFTGQGGIGRAGKSPSTPAIPGGTQVSRFTSSPFSGRSNMGGGGSTGKNAKMWANKKSNGAP